MHPHISIRVGQWVGGMFNLFFFSTYLNNKNWWKMLYHVKKSEKKRTPHCPPEGLFPCKTNKSLLLIIDWWTKVSHNTLEIMFWLSIHWNNRKKGERSNSRRIQTKTKEDKRHRDNWKPFGKTHATWKWYESESV